jgi:hypothetical protein
MRPLGLDRPTAAQASLISSCVSAMADGSVI